MKLQGGDISDPRWNDGGNNFTLGVKEQALRLPVNDDRYCGSSVRTFDGRILKITKLW